MSDQMAGIAQQLAELMAEVRANRNDTKQLKESTEGRIDALQQEFRDETKAIRADLARVTSLQNSDIAAAKKKSPGWKTLFAFSTGD